MINFVKNLASQFIYKLTYKPCFWVTHFLTFETH